MRGRLWPSLLWLASYDVNGDDFRDVLAMQPTHFSLAQHELSDESTLVDLCGLDDQWLELRKSLLKDYSEYQ